MIIRIYFLNNNKKNIINKLTISKMKIISFAIKSAFITGALTAGAFITGAAVGTILNKDKVIDKFKKLQLKKNNSASTK